MKNFNAKTLFLGCFDGRFYLINFLENYMKITYKNNGKEVTCLSMAKSKLPEMISIPFVEKVAAKVFGKMGIDAKKIIWSNKGQIEAWLQGCIENYKNGTYSDWQIFEGEIIFYAN